MANRPDGARVIGGNEYANITASALVKTGPGDLLGIFVASASSGTVKLWNQTTAATPVLVNTFSVVAGTWYPLPFAFTNGLYITIGGTADISVCFS